MKAWNGCPRSREKASGAGGAQQRTGLAAATTTSSASREGNACVRECVEADNNRKEGDTTSNFGELVARVSGARVVGEKRRPRSMAVRC